MPGDVGLVAQLVETVFGWFTSEDGFLEMKQRRALASKKRECQDALADHRWDDLRRLTAEFEQLSHKP